MVRSLFQVNSQLNNRLFLSGYAENFRNALQRRFLDPNGNVIRPLARSAQRVNRGQRNGLDLSLVGFETNYQVFKEKVALKGYALRESAKDAWEKARSWFQKHLKS